MDLLREVENWAAPFVLVMTGGAARGGRCRARNGLGPLLAQPGKFHTLAEFLPVFVPSLTAMIGFWATLSLNMPDFTRFGRSQREQIIGQVVALPTTMSLFAAMGVMITSATAIIYGQAIWDPVQLVGKFSSPVVVAISMFTVVVATLAVNIAANVVSPANDFANAFPRLHQLQDRRPDHRARSASRFSRGGCSPIRPATSTPGCSATRAASDRSPACWSSTTGSCASASCGSRISIWPTASTAAGTCARSPRPRSAASLAWGGLVDSRAQAALRLRVVRRLLRRRRSRTSRSHAPVHDDRRASRAALAEICVRCVAS